MAEMNISSTTTTDLKGAVTDFSVASRVPDSTGAAKDVWWDYPDAAQNLGYYKSIPELKGAIKALAIWTCGKGWTADIRTTNLLSFIRGWGEDSFQSICQNLIIQKKIFGDAFAEIIRESENGRLINIKCLYPGNMRCVVSDNGMIDHYEQRSNIQGGVPKLFKPWQILHLVNDRIANEIHGISVIEVLKFIIDAKNEALQDERTIRHREMLGVLDVDSNDPVKIQQAVTQYQNAVKNKEVLVTIKGTSELKDNPMTIKDRLQWLQYLDNLFYQTVGVPKVIATSEGFTEAGGKVGFLTFEPVYTAEQTELEADLWSQIGIEVKFNRPPSLSGMMQESEDKNTGQTGIQPNEVNMSMSRTE